jgi:hypothetical protein
VINSSHRPLPDNKNTHSNRYLFPRRDFFRTHNLDRRAAAVLRFRPRGLWDWQSCAYCMEAKLRVKVIESFFISASCYTLHYYWFLFFLSKHVRVCSRPGSSVGIATGYGLDGPGIESQWGRNFSQLSRPALGPTHNGYRVFPGGRKRPRRDADPSPPSSAEV